MEKERPKHSTTITVLRIFGLIVATVIILAILLNIIYWGTILIGGFIGLRWYCILGLLLPIIFIGMYKKFKRK